MIDKTPIAPSNGAPLSLNSQLARWFNVAFLPIVVATIGCYASVLWVENDFRERALQTESVIEVLNKAEEEIQAAHLSFHSAQPETSPSNKEVLRRSFMLSIEVAESAVIAVAVGSDSEDFQKIRRGQAWTAWQKNFGSSVTVKKMDNLSELAVFSIIHIANFREKAINAMGNAEEGRVPEEQVANAYSQSSESLFDLSNLARQSQSQIIETETQITQRVSAIWVAIFAMILAYSYLSLQRRLSKTVTEPLTRIWIAARQLINGKYEIDIKADESNEVGMIAEDIRRLADVMKNQQAENERQRTEVLETIKRQEAQNQSLAEAKLAALNVLDDVETVRQQVKSERDKLEIILRSISDAVLVTNPQRSIIFANHAAETLLGVPIAQITGLHLRAALKMETPIAGEDALEFVEKAIRFRSPVEMVGKNNLVTNSGSRLAIGATASPMLNNDSDLIGLIITLRDVTREREEDRVKSEFISHASHQLRTPLTSAKWMIEMLTDDPPTCMDESQKETLRNITEVLHRMNEIVNTLLKVSRLDSNRVVFTKKDVDINKLLKEIVKEQESSLTRKNQKLELDLDSEVLPIMTDLELLRECLANFVSNAIKYTPTGGQVKVASRMDKEKDHIRVDVTDSGMGIPLEDQKSIFTKFFRAENAKQAQSDGNGLGLYIVKQFMEILGGSASFVSVENQGSTFTAIVPITPPAQPNSN